MPKRTDISKILILGSGPIISRLADDDGAGAEDQDLGDVSSFWHGSVARLSLFWSFGRCGVCLKARPFNISDTAGPSTVLKRSASASTSLGMTEVVKSRISPFPLLHHLGEVFEQIMRVVGTGTGFRVILHAEERQVLVPQAFQCVVVQIHVREFDFARGQRIRIDGEVVVVRRDLDFAAVQLLHRMIAAVMPELQLVGLASERDAGKLVAKTNSKDRLAAHETANVVDRVSTGFGISGPVG